MDGMEMMCMWVVVVCVGEIAVTDGYDDCRDGVRRG